MTQLASESSTRGKAVRPLVLLFALAFATPHEALSQTATRSPETVATGQQQAPERSVQQTLPPTKVAAMAARIDALLAEGLRQRGIEPLPIVDDPTFVRRAYLSIVGRIPTLAETAAFLDDQADDRRAGLIDRLLDSPGHVGHEANYWFDLLRVKSRLRQVSGEPFAHWIREAIRTDLPYDQFVRAMLTATGPAHAEGNGATGYLLRDANMPHDAMANTLRIFLGTRLECAQCHNHPFADWTQRQFYGMAAFFGGLRYRAELPRGQLQELRQAVQSGDERQQQAGRRLLQTLSAGLAGSGTGVERLPQDYQYKDARPREPVFADTIFGADVDIDRPRPAAPGRTRGRPQRPPLQPAAEVDSRAAFADWLTSPDNPRFAQVAANRTWQRLFGRGLIEPVDDLKDDSAAVHPKLLAHLEQLLVDLHFDLRQFERVLLRTQLFQRQCFVGDVPPEQAYAFPGPLLRRLSAEQLWDSLLTLVDAELDAHLPPTDARARATYARQAQAQSASPDELLAMLQQPRAFDQDQAQRLLQQRREQFQARQQELNELQQQLRQARREGNQQELEKLQRELRALQAEARSGQRGAGELLRASDLPQPAPPGHLLRQFGQSDRETIEGGNRAANVPQALTLLNGFLDQRVLARGSSLLRALDAASSPAATIEAAFLTTLNREPSAAESERWLAAIGSQPDTALHDLVWVLCNSNEFRFQR